MKTWEGIDPYVNGVMCKYKYHFQLVEYDLRVQFPKLNYLSLVYQPCPEIGGLWEEGR